MGHTDCDTDDDDDDDEDGDDDDDDDDDDYDDDYDDYILMLLLLLLLRCRCSCSCWYWWCVCSCSCPTPFFHNLSVVLSIHTASGMPVESASCFECFSPTEVLISDNYYKRQWRLSSVRRLRNVICFLEWAAWFSRDSTEKVGEFWGKGL